MTTMEDDESLDLDLKLGNNRCFNDIDLNAPPPEQTTFSHPDQTRISPIDPSVPVDQAAIYPIAASSPTAEDTNNGDNRSENRSENLSGSGNGRRRRQSRIANDNDTVAAPYPWATERRSRIHDINTLLSRNIYKIWGDVQCRRCEERYSMEYDLTEKSDEIRNFFNLNWENMKERAPKVWMSPVLPNCTKCNQHNTVKPIISDDKEAINWLFLLLGQMLGCCTLEQLKYFCKHTKNHRTGAKDRVLYLTYVTLIKQLEGIQFDF